MTLDRSSGPSRVATYSGPQRPTWDDQGFILISPTRLQRELHHPVVIVGVFAQLLRGGATP